MSDNLLQRMAIRLSLLAITAISDNSTHEWRTWYNISVGPIPPMMAGVGPALRVIGTDCNTVGRVLGKCATFAVRGRYPKG